MRSAPAAFSLIEAMITVAVAGVIASLAVTSLAPLVRRAELGSATDSVIGFVARARMEAFTNRRCTQVLIFDKADGRRQRLLFRELNSFDCDGTTGGQSQTMESAPRIDATQPLWIDVDDLQLDTDRISASFVNHPSTLTNAEGASCPTAVTGCRELRFRPNGRVWSPDAVITDDAVTIRVRHLSLNEEHRVGVASNGVFLPLAGGR